QAAQPVYDLAKESKKIKTWQAKAIIVAVVSLVITVWLVMVLINKWLFPLSTWSELEHYDVIKWSAIAVGAFWNVVMFKMLSDRFDPDKVNAYRDGLRK
ncbi:MAG TPA: hypothetical protein VIM79_17740, partial [Niastella sp.]